jgi:hypothetical protein
MEGILKVVNWLFDTHDKVLFVEDISGFGALFLFGTMIFVVVLCCSKKLRSKFF